MSRMFPKMTVTFDNGDEFEIQAASRDMAHMERDGVALDDSKPVRTLYQIALYTLRRLERLGKITPTDPIPKTVEDLEDVADVDPDDEDPEGKGSGQEAPTG